MATLSPSREASLKVCDEKLEELRAQLVLLRPESLERQWLMLEADRWLDLRFKRAKAA